MSKKDYNAIAAIFRNIRSQIGPDSTPAGTLDTVAFDLAMLFRQDNPRFDTGRFFSACDRKG